MTRLVALTIFVGFCAGQTPSPPAGEKEPVFTFYSTVFGSSAPGGLTGLVYLLEPNTSSLPNFKKLTPVGKFYTMKLEVPPQSFLKGFPGITGRYEWFAIDYSGEIWISKAGKYQFALNSDDGSKLYIDGHNVIDNDGIHPPQVETGSAKLKEGIHQIRVSYFQGPPDSVALTLQVAGPGESMHVLNMKEFTAPPEVKAK
jgi:PA14 domain